jgi:hypothetical protein
MRRLKNIIVIIIFLHIGKFSFSQNAMINLLTQQSGIVKKGEKLFLEVSITNANSKKFIGIYKIIAQVNVPNEILTIDSIGHILPNGWKILQNNGNSISISNGMNMIAATDNRILLIALVANKIGGPLTISGEISFSNGNAPGTELGFLDGDLLGDNFSTTTCKVIK